MSRKGLRKSFVDEEEAEEKKIRRTAPLGYVPWSNPTELQATDRNSRQGPGTSGTRRMVTSARHQDTGPGAESLKIHRKDPPPGCVPWSNPNELQTTNRNSRQGPGTSGTRRMVTPAKHQDTGPSAEALRRPGRHRPVFIEEERPGAVRVPGIGDDGLTIEEENDEQASIATPNDESTVNVTARAVDTEEERRMRHELEQLRHMQIRHERDQLRQMLDNAPILTPVIATKRDVENPNENVQANHDNLAGSDDPKCGHKGRRWFAMSAILLVVVAVAITLALVLQPEPTPPPDPLMDPLMELLSSASFDGGVALADPSTPQNRALTWLAGDPNLASYTDQEKIQRYALATLYYTTKGDSWFYESYWLSYETVCDKWYQTKDDYWNIGPTINCTTDGISSLCLEYNNLQGSVPPEIGMLSNSLELLWLSHDVLVGDIPAEIGKLTKLTSLSLWSSSMTGTLPNELGLLTKLTRLDLGMNGFTGTVPTM